MRSARPKTIRKILRQKIDKWLESLPSDLHDPVKEDVIVTGGAINSLLMGEKINDFDLYFKTADTALLLATHYMNVMRDNNQIRPGSECRIDDDNRDRVIIHIPSDGVAGNNDIPDDTTLDEAEGKVEPEPKPETDGDSRAFKPQFMSMNAITLSGKIQLIMRFTGNIEKIHENFDFIHPTCSYDYKEGSLDLPAKALESMLTKTLYYHGSLYPVASIFRMKKYLERGWRISAGEQIKIMWQISKLDLSNINVLREQLTGVDLLFMRALIYQLENRPENQNFDTEYLMEVCDKIFNGE